MRNISLKNKLINHLMKNGEKKTGEKIVLKSVKELQKNSFKNSKNLIKIALVNATPIFKIHTVKKKKKKNKNVKKIPFFIASNSYRVSLAIKLILSSLKQKQVKTYTKLNEEIILISQKKGLAIQIKNEIQKQVLLNKRYLNFYRWR